MEPRQLSQLVALSQAFWPGAEARARVAAETVSAVSVLGLADDRKLERAATILFHRSERDGPGAIAEAAQQPFFRLLAAERFVLMALHRARWSYERIGRALQLEPREVEATAWAARLHLTSQPGQAMYLAHPTGSRLRAETCPEYELRRPWSQRFMDDELDGRERHFVQNHTLGCESCRTVLSRARAVFYAVEARLPAWSDDDEQSVRELGSLLRTTHTFRHPADRTFIESVRLYLQRPDGQISAVVLLAASLWIVTRTFTHLLQ